MKKFGMTLLMLGALTTAISGQNIKKLPEENWFIFAAPLSLADFSPRWRAGATYVSGQRLGGSLDLGYGNRWINPFRLFYPSSFNKSHYSLFEVRPEIRYFTKGRPQNESGYWSVEFFYLHMAHQEEDSYFHPEDPRGVDSVIYFDQADFKKDKFGFHIKKGLIIPLGNKFCLDLYTGIGIARRAFRYDNVSNAQWGGHGFYEWYVPANLFEGAKTILHVSMGCKIGVFLKHETK